MSRFYFILKMKIQQLSLFITLLLALSPFETMAQETPKNQYPEDFVQQYMADCKERSVTEGVPPEDTETFCTCTLNEFQSQYTLEQFKKLTADSKENQDAADALSEVGFSCFEPILYEE